MKTDKWIPNGERRYILLTASEKSPEDVEAESLVRSFLEEAKPQMEFEVIVDDLSASGTPRLLAAYDAFCGLPQILAFIRQERLLC